MHWNFSEDRPIYAQIIEQIKRAVVSGELKPGDKVPPVRELASDAGVNPNTMQRALSELERSGLLYSQRTSGRFITEDKDLIEKMKAEIASDKVREFLLSMKELGLTRSQTVELIENYEEADNNE